MPATTLEAARAAHAGSRWNVAYERFKAAAAEVELGTDDLAALADAAWWLGETDESLTLSEAVYRRCLQGGATPLAARVAIEMGFLWMLRGEETIGSGWVSRASRLLADLSECAAHGYLLHLDVLQALGDGGFDDAVALAHRIEGLAERCDDPTLGAVALVLEGVATVKRGDVHDGLALLDEAMLSVRAGAVAANWAGNLYCHLMGLFLEIADFPRARAWTDATERWCDQRSHAAMFTGICRVHRAQLLNLEGSWEAAERRATQACRDLEDMNVGVVAAAWYEIGELHRVRGHLESAEDAFGRAHGLGRDPQPGLARLRLAQGRIEAADAALRTALAATGQALARVPLLAASIDVAEVVDDAAGAADSARELTEIAATYHTPGLLAVARQAAGSAELVAGRPVAALPLLRDAWQRWRGLDAHYEAARTQARLARALAEVGDIEAATRERASATAVFEHLGARGDLDAVQDTERSAAAPGGLSPRELDVLRLVAAGASNRSVAGQLSISVRTVERHLSNVFVKLGVSSRTAAARFAFTHGLLDDPRPG